MWKPPQEKLLLTVNNFFDVSRSTYCVRTNPIHFLRTGRNGEVLYLFTIKVEKSTEIFMLTCSSSIFFWQWQCFHSIIIFTVFNFYSHLAIKCLFVYKRCLTIILEKSSVFINTDQFLNTNLSLQLNPLSSSVDKVVQRWSI